MDKAELLAVLYLAVLAGAAGYYYGRGAQRRDDAQHEQRVRVLGLEGDLSRLRRQLEILSGGTRIEQDKAASA